MQNYKTSNNASWLLLSSLGASWTTAILKTWQWALFPSTYPFLLTIEKIAATVITQREIVKCTNKTWDNLTIVRSQGTCPPNDSSSTPWTTAFWFDADDRVSLYIPSEVIQDLYSWIADKLNINWQLRTWNGTWKINYNNWSWNETELALSTAWKVLTSNWVSSAPTFETPTVDIVWLSESTSDIASDDMLIMYDVSLTANKKHLAKASTTNEWLVEMATDTEATTWTDQTRYINPKQARDNYLIITDVIVFTRDVSAAGWTVNYTHWLWKVPKLIKFSMKSAFSVWYWNSDWVYSAYTNKNYCVYWWYNFNSSATTTAAAIAFGMDWWDWQYWAVTAISTTNFTITWTKGWSPPATAVSIMATLIA